MLAKTLLFVQITRLVRTLVVLGRRNRPRKEREAQRIQSPNGGKNAQQHVCVSTKKKGGKNRLLLSREDPRPRKKSCNGSTARVVCDGLYAVLTLPTPVLDRDIARETCCQVEGRFWLSLPLLIYTRPNSQVRGHATGTPAWG